MQEKLEKNAESVAISGNSFDCKKNLKFHEFRLVWSD